MDTLQRLMKPDTNDLKTLFNYSISISKKRDKKLENKIKTENKIKPDPDRILDYVMNVIRGRWEEAEPYIKKDPFVAFGYAHNVIRGRWKEAEPYIIEIASPAYYYASGVMKERWPEAEPIIMRDSYFAYNYAKYVIKERWIEAEEFISKESFWYKVYIRDILNIDIDLEFDIDSLNEAIEEINKTLDPSIPAACPYYIPQPDRPDRGITYDSSL